MNQLGQAAFYVLDKQTAEAIDRVRDEAGKYLAAMVSGGNVYLLDADVFEPSEYEDIDPGETVKGCSYTLDPALTSEQKQRMLAGLIELGYAVAPYPDRLLIIPWFRDAVSDALARDLRRLLPRKKTVPVQPTDNLPAQALYYLAQETDHDRHGEGHDCGLCDPRGRSFGSSLYVLDLPGLKALRAFQASEDDDSIGEWEMDQESQMTCYGSSISASVENTLDEAMKEGLLVLNYADRYSFLEPWLAFLFPLIDNHTHEQELFAPDEMECHLCRARLIYEIIRPQQTSRKRGQQ